MKSTISTHQARTGRYAVQGSRYAFDSFVAVASASPWFKLKDKERKPCHQ